MADTDTVPELHANGLTSDESRRRLVQFGPNAIPDTSMHPWRMALEKFCAPVPWMLEAAIILEIVLGKYVEAAIIAGLLLFNAALGLFQEERAQATLAALKSRLALTASVRRDGAWKTVPAAELVRPSPMPNAWRIGNLTTAGAVMGFGELVFCTSILAFGAYRMGMAIGTLQTLAFVAIVFGNQATTYNNRERRRLWSSRPSIWLAASSVADILIAVILSVGGIAMAPLPVLVVAATLAAAMVFAVLLDCVKVPLFRRLRIT